LVRILAYSMGAKQLALRTCLVPYDMLPASLTLLTGERDDRGNCRTIASTEPSWHKLVKTLQSSHCNEELTSRVMSCLRTDLLNFHTPDIRGLISVLALEVLSRLF
jgi:hypothetical protein